MTDFGVVHAKFKIYDKFSKYHENSKCSDVQFSVGNENLMAHRMILAIQSSFFENLLYNDDFNQENSKQPQIKIDAPPKAFKVLLKFMYHGTLDLRDFAIADLTDLLELSHKFEITELETGIIDYLCVVVNHEIVCMILNHALLIGAKKLEEQCWTIIEMFIEGHIKVDLNISLSIVEKFYERPRKVTEAKLFEAVYKLTQNSNFATKKQKKAILAKIDYEKFSASQLIELVVPAKVVNDTTLLSLMYNAHNGVKKVNLKAVQELVVLSGENPEHILNSEDKFTTHEVNVAKSCILLDLQTNFRFNCLEFKLNSDNNYQYKYFIEVSKTQEKWSHIVDHTKSFCYSKQRLFFPETTARFIKIVGTETFDSNVFQCNSFEVKLVDDPPKFCSGFIYPTENVATIGKAFSNITNEENKCKFEFLLLDGNFKDNGLDTPYTSQIISYGGLVVRFCQPYLLDSCRFRLWDYDGRKYSYKIFVTSDLENYEIVCDRSDEMLDGWQVINFSPRPILRIKIVGVKVSIGKEMRLVHFEAPAGNVI